MKLFNREPKHKSVSEAVKWNLENRGQITQLECLKKYGSWRLSQYIMVFRRKGMNIISEEKRVRTRFNFETTIVIYRLIK